MVTKTSHMKESTVRIHSKKGDLNRDLEGPKKAFIKNTGDVQSFGNAR